MKYPPWRRAHSRSNLNLFLHGYQHQVNPKQQTVLFYFSFTTKTKSGDASDSSSQQRLGETEILSAPQHGL